MYIYIVCAYTDIPNFDLCDELFKNLCEKKPTPCIWLITPRPCIPGFPVRGPTHHVRVQHPAFYTSISTPFVFGRGKLSHLIRLISRRSRARGREEHRTGCLGATWVHAGVAGDPGTAPQAASQGLACPFPGSHVKLRVETSGRLILSREEVWVEWAGLGSHESSPQELMSWARRAIPKD